MKGAHLIATMLATPWALQPEYITAMAGIVARWHIGIDASDEVMAKIDEDKNTRNAKRGEAVRAGGGSIAVLPMYGVVAQRDTAGDVSGPGTMSTQRFSSNLRSALADETVGGILIDIDSPGGSVYGVGELADEIYQARSSKPVFAVANSLAASAAYWLGSAASEFYVTPGGEVGSIGVYTAHEDWSKALDAAGVKTTLISAGAFKVEGNPYEPLSDDAKRYTQSRIDDYYGAFTKSVSRGRGAPIAQVRDGMGQGRCVGAQQAVDSKMVDGIATFDQALKKLHATVRQNAKASGSAAHAHRERELSIIGA